MLTVAGSGNLLRADTPPYILAFIPMCCRTRAKDPSACPVRLIAEIEAVAGLGMLGNRRTWPVPLIPEQ